MSSQELILYAVIAAAVIALVQGVYMVVYGRTLKNNERVDSRFERLGRGSIDEAKSLEQLRKQMTQHQDASGIPLYSFIAPLAHRANLVMTPAQLMLAILLLCCAVFAGMSYATELEPWINLLTAIVVGVGGTVYWLKMKAEKRMAILEEQLPDAIELMVRSLRVGHPFSSTVSIVANEVPAPFGIEMKIVADEVSYGRDMGDTLKELADRLEMQDLRFLAVAVAIQQQSGGNLAEVLAGLAKVIRARFRLFRRVNAITAEAKWSGKLLSMFPILCLIGIQFFRPDYFDEVSESAYFVPVAFVVVSMLVVNMIVMRALVNIKV